MLRRAVIALMLLAALSVRAAPAGAAGPEAPLPETSGPPAGEAAAFDHGAYSALLVKHVTDGTVDYKALGKDRAALDAYLERIADLPPSALERMPENEKLALYINAYNAYTLKAILDNYPVKSIKKIRGVWDRLQFKLAGQDLTLGHIEHEILRKQFADPRVHFTLVCASIGCPKLRAEAYTGEAISRMLEEETQGFITDRTRVRLDRDRKTLYLSSIFKWFEKDFGDVEAFVARYLPRDDVRFIRLERVRIRYLRYDWSLNDRQ